MVWFILGFPGGSEVKASACNATLPACNPGRSGFNPLLSQIKKGFCGDSAVKNLPAMRETGVQSLGREDPRRRKWQTTPAFFLGESHGHRSLADCSQWGCKKVWHNLVTKSSTTVYWAPSMQKAVFLVLVSGTCILRTEIINVFQKQIHKWFPFLGVRASWWFFVFFFFEVCFFPYLTKQQFNQMRRPKIKIVTS